MMSIRPKRTHFCRKMLCFQQLTQLNLVIAVEITVTRANAFNLTDPAVVVNERAVTSRHNNEEYSSNPPLVEGPIVKPMDHLQQLTKPISSVKQVATRLQHDCRIILNTA